MKVLLVGGNEWTTGVKVWTRARSLSEVKEKSYRASEDYAYVEMGD
jgi:hypothetical protein